MINFVTTANHDHTLRHVMRSLVWGRCRIWHYEQLFRRRTLPTGTWIFTDHERLSAFELSLAATIAHRLEKKRARVLNHPAKVSSRYQMLLDFQREGINSFGVWRCESKPRPGSFPVFIRSTYDHHRPRSKLIADQASLDEHLATMRQKGISLIGLLVVEYAGTEVSPGVWERYATYRVGNQIIAHHKAIDHGWIVKDGVDAASLDKPTWDDFVRREREFVFENRYEETLRRAFELAGIEYGRADFAIVDGSVQIYEINTNPTHRPWQRLFAETHPDRRDTQRFSETRLMDAICSLHASSRRRVELKSWALKRQRFPQNWSCGLMRP